MEENSKIYSEKMEYLEEVFRVRAFIIKLMHCFGFEFEERKLLVPKTEWENRIQFDGAIGLMCWKNGLPMSLFTPWGEMRFVDIDKNGGFKQDIPESKVKKFMEEIEKLFYLQGMAPGYGVNGFRCDTYSIGCLPWNRKTWVCSLPMIKGNSPYLGQTEDDLLAIYKEGRQLCIDVYGRETA